MRMALDAVDHRHMTELAAVQEDPREQTRLALGAMLIPVFFVIMFAVCIIDT